MDNSTYNSLFLFLLMGVTYKGWDSLHSTVELMILLPDICCIFASKGESKVKVKVEGCSNSG